jgi:hypothetical protein
MNKVKRAARRRVLQQLRPTGPNRFRKGAEKLVTKKVASDLVMLAEKPVYDHVENGQVPGSQRGTSWLKENRLRRTAGLPQNRV